MSKRSTLDEMAGHGLHWQQGRVLATIFTNKGAATFAMTSLLRESIEHMTFRCGAMLVGAISLLAGCASTYTAPQGTPTVSVEYRNSGSTPLLYFDVFEDPKICGKRRPVKPDAAGRYAFRYPANSDLSFRIMYSQVKSSTVKMCDMYVTFAAESGYDFQIQSTDSEQACYIRVLKTGPSGVSAEADIRMRQSSVNMLGDMAKSWCEPEA